ncbi:hypothetical protein [Marinithermus hydrothermalis]|uniref:Uncharacterized protein n=1 Tax=Marinithermus hydrothermalis (strain DSM 14884 / JCM 11576 / T1) TaxID=869210 RepID=F2NKS3_MARHT|nr:hypothetical protein [Marinithermus hydrothermalis]AEB10836.1 hypothetical protein Marky_0073 [Marinithermus hydrothermalis DSM 14884]
MQGLFARSIWLFAFLGVLGFFLGIADGEVDLLDLASLMSTALGKYGRLGA